MEFLGELWIPILVSAAAVWVASSILHLVIPIHNNDYAGLPEEDAVLDAMREQPLPPGEYAFPFSASMKELGEPEMIEKHKRGPVGFLTIQPNGPPGIGRNLALWFAYSIVISIFAAYITSFLTINSAREAFRLTGTVAVLSLSLIHI